MSARTLLFPKPQVPQLRAWRRWQWGEAFSEVCRRFSLLFLTGQVAFCYLKTLLLSLGPFCFHDADAFSPLHVPWSTSGTNCSAFSLSSLTLPEPACSGSLPTSSSCHRFITPRRFHLRSNLLSSVIEIQDLNSLSLTYL